MTDRYGLMEPIAIQDTFAMAVKVEDMEHGMRRLIFYAPHGNEQHVCVKLVMPAACLITMTEAIAPHAQEIAENLLTLVPRSNNHNAG
jgi:hypothetical protein